MRKLQLVFMPLVLLFSAGSTTGQLENPGNTIRKIKFNKGSFIISKTVMQIEGKITAPDIPKNSDIRIGMTLRNCELTEITMVSKEGSIVETELDCLASIMHIQTVGKVEDKDINETNTIVCPLDGKIAVFANKKGIWQGKLKDAETTKDIASELENYISPDEGSILPNKPISLGDSWTLKGNQLRKFAPDAINLSGTAECTFEKVVNLNERNHGLVKFNIHLEFLRLDENQEEQRVKQNISGNGWIDMKTGLETELSGKITTVINGTFGPLENAKLSGSGVVTITNKLVEK